jgi:hypothetical protein
MIETHLLNKPLNNFFSHNLLHITLQPQNIIRSQTFRQVCNQFAFSPSVTFFAVSAVKIVGVEAVPVVAAAFVGLRMRGGAGPSARRVAAKGWSRLEEGVD